MGSIIVERRKRAHNEKDRGIQREGRKRPFFLAILKGKRIYLGTVKRVAEGTKRQ